MAYATYEDVQANAFNITGSIQYRFEPNQETVEMFEFLVVDDDSSLSNAYNVYVTFTNLNDDEDTFGYSFLSTGSWITGEETNKTRSELEGNTYIIDTYVKYSESDYEIAQLLTREIIQF